MMSEQRQIVIVGRNHPKDPPKGEKLSVLEFEDDEVVVVGWDPHTRVPSPTYRWAMLREHVRPVVAEAPLVIDDLGSESAPDSGHTRVLARRHAGAA